MLSQLDTNLRKIRVNLKKILKNDSDSSWYPIILNSLYLFNQRKESRERQPIRFKQKRKASELAEAKPEDILPFIYQPEGI